jgi:hypothetical protein
MRPMRPLLFLALVACSKSSSDKPPQVPPPGDKVDEGEIVTTTDGKVTANELFTITKTADRLYIMTSSATTPEAKVRNVQTGLLETDHAYKPVSMTYNYQAEKGGFTYKLGGAPLTLERKPDSGKPERVEATGPVDVFVEGPGLIAMQALCRVEQPTTLPTISDFESAYKGKVVVKTVGKAASLKKLTIAFLDTFEVEVYCDGPKLVASGLRGNKLWNVRKGSEAVFEAARDAT